jgi:hypothetical protein
MISNCQLKNKALPVHMVSLINCLQYRCFKRLTAGASADDNSGSSDDDEFIGPRPPAPGDAALSASEASAREIEERARRMRDRLEGKDKQVICL